MLLLLLLLTAGSAFPVYFANLWKRNVSSRYIWCFNCLDIRQNVGGFSNHVSIDNQPFRQFLICYLSTFLLINTIAFLWVHQLQVKETNSDEVVGGRENFCTCLAIWWKAHSYFTMIFYWWLVKFHYYFHMQLYDSD